MASKRQAFDRLEEDRGNSTTDGEMRLDDFESGKRRRYVVKTGDEDSDEIVCNKKLTSRDYICLGVGVVVLVIAVGLFIVIGVALQPKAAQGPIWEQVRLPRTIVPDSYNIYLDTNLPSLEVSGNVTMTATVNGTTKYVIFHSKDMSVRDISVQVGSRTLGINRVFNYSKNDFMIVELSESLNDGETVVTTMKYNYTLREDLIGFYKSSYTMNGQEHMLATTQFEPTDARRAFPCFDEPALKANFTISISHPSEYMAVSNMPPTGPATKDGNKMRTTFDTSYRMSSYLVAFVVSDFQCNPPDTTASGVKVRVCSSPAVFNATKYAQQVATFILNYYETFYNVKFPLPKQDLFAIPDFAAGAMENWGLITYRETALLYNEAENPQSSKQRVAIVIAHELAHQWFGNLVTMEWWDGLWLNEGFASFVEYIGTAAKEPDWNMQAQFLVDTFQYAMLADGLNESHPIIQEVSNPDEINGLFDSISYDKGASIIRMLKSYLGNTAFQTGLQNYLNAHKFSNAETVQLWTALDKAATNNGGTSVLKLMDRWTKQMGYPVVTFTSASSSSITLTQDRFLLSPLPANGSLAPSPYDYVWIIPFNYIIQNSPTTVRSHLITSKTESITISSSSNSFIKANVGQFGFYRVNYDNDNWMKISKHLNTATNKSSILSASDRAGVLDDALALASSGRLETATALELTKYLVQERDYVPWSTALTWFGVFGDRLSLSPVYGRYQSFIRSLLTPITQEYSLNRRNLTHLETFLRSSVLSNGWRYGITAISSDALTMFREWMNNGDSKKILPDLRTVVYPAAIATGGLEEWEYLWGWYTNTTDPYEKRICLNALAESTEPWILSRYLQYSMSGKVRSQDILTVITRVSRNVHGRFLAWNFVRQNWDTLFMKYGGGSFSFPRLIRTITASFSTQQQLDDVKQFFGQHTNVGSGQRAVGQAYEVINGNIAWLSSNEATIDNWLASNQ